MIIVALFTCRTNLGLQHLGNSSRLLQTSSQRLPRTFFAELKRVQLQSVSYALAHVKALAASDASEQAILVALDMLVDMAVDSAHPDLPLFQNLRAQAARLQDKLCIRGLCLEVLGDKCNDRVSSAVAKLLKEGKSAKVDKASRKEDPSQQMSSLPLPGSTIPQYSMVPQYPQGVTTPPLQEQFPIGYQQQPYQPFPHSLGQESYQFGYGGRGRYFQDGRGVCHFCGANGHLLRDCEDLKRLRENPPK